MIKDKNGNYTCEIIDHRDGTRQRYSVKARTPTEAQYKMCTYMLRHTDMTFEDFEVLSIRKEWWET